MPDSFAPRLLLALVLAAVLLPGRCFAQAGGEAGGLLVVLNKGEATASLVDPATGETVATLPTGTGPHEVAVSADGRRAVVTDYGDQTTVGATLTVLDLPNRRVEKTVPLGAHERPHGIAYLPDGRVVVTAEKDSAVVVVDVEAGAVVRAAPTGQPISHMLALSPDGRFVYTANILAGTVSKVDLAAGRTVKVATVGPVAEAIAVSPDGAEVWAASQEQGRVVVLDAETLAERAAVDVPGRPIRIAFTPDGARALVTSVASGTLHVLDARARTVLGTVAFPVDPDHANAATGAGPGGPSTLPIGVQVAPYGRTAYVALMGQDRVAVVDLGALAVTHYVDVGAMPDGLGYAAVLAPAPVGSTSDLLGAMRARYGDTWYRTLTFVQETTFFGPDGSENVQTWYEAALLPGHLRIDIAPLDRGNMMLVVHDSVYVYRGGRLADRRSGGNPLSLLGFDLYFLPVEETLARMQALGIDTGVFREDTWQGRPAYVVGAAAGDERSPQVWFDRERLVFLRLVERETQGGQTHVQDVRFENYEPLAGGWIAPRVELYVDGRLVMREVYDQVRAGVALDPALFDPARWQEVRWWE